MHLWDGAGGSAQDGPFRQRSRRRSGGTASGPAGGARLAGAARGRALGRRTRALRAGCQSTRRHHFIARKRGRVGGGRPAAVLGQDRRPRQFWAKAAELGAVIFVQPAGNTDKRMLRNRLMITVGQPLEEAYALSSLIYEGVMDQFPKLKIMVAHGGGYLPFYTGRHDND